MTSASSIPLSTTLRVLSQNINGFPTKITMRKRKQKRIVALGSLLRSLEVDFFAIQEPHFVTVEDRQAGMQCLSKYGYGLDGPLHEEGRRGVALAWKTSKWTLQSMKFLSPRALKASLSSGPLEITLVVAHFHHKHTRRQSQWKDIAKELHGPNLILCADHNSLVVKHRDAFAPPEFEHDTSLRAKEQEVTTLAKAGLPDAWVDIHCPTLTDIKDINWTLKSQALATMQVQWRPKSASKWHPFQWEAIPHCPTAEGHRAVPSLVSRTGDCMHVWQGGRADLLRLFQRTLFRQADPVPGDAVRFLYTLLSTSPCERRYA